MLSYDTARCLGHDNPICKGCLRLEPGCPIRQSYAAFPNPVGHCEDKIVYAGSVTTDLRGIGNEKAQD